MKRAPATTPPLLTPTATPPPAARRGAGTSATMTTPARVTPTTHGWPTDWSDPGRQPDRAADTRACRAGEGPFGLLARAARGRYGCTTRRGRGGGRDGYPRSER